VTKEDFRLLNSPAWTPDSEFIVARKHFSSTRSLGAGEMWLYHRAGGEGVQLTKRPNEQKDAGEPSVSPDGRYVYFSQDTTPGIVFEYNKDSNKQIYVIQRLDRETGELEPYITGPGGSIRPTPSHDGKSIAFVRRIRGKSILHINDVASGKETPIYDDLERDMQEAWAIHGVYPAIAWTPDDSTIVFWAAGKIRKINVENKQVTQIPFHVKTTRKIQNALRFPVSVAPEEFDVRMLRWVQVSPNGNEVLYEALGHLYTRGLPDGSPKRVTKQNDHFELLARWKIDCVHNVG
jgi:dipeptidyl aminopeptidase/acylaminoacyl peptidase